MTQRLAAAKTSIGVNVGLLALKAGVASATGSVGLLAETLHSGLDLVASALAYVGIQKAMEPADENHPYGHYRFENLSALAQVLLIGLTAAFVIADAAQHLASPRPIHAAPLGIAVLLVSLVGAWATSRWLDRVAREEKSAALESDAYHFTTDAWASVAVLIGLAGNYAGFFQADAWAAIAVAAVMLYGCVKLAQKSLLALTDTTPEPQCLHEIETVLQNEPAVTSYHKLRARQSGSKVFVDIHVRLKPKASLYRAHVVSHRVKSAIMACRPEVEDVHIHLEPEPDKTKQQRRKRKAHEKNRNAKKIEGH